MGEEARVTSSQPQDVEQGLGQPPADQDGEVQVCPTCGQHLADNGGTVHCLLVITGKTTGIYYPVPQGKVVTIGRGADAHLRLRDGLASRRHAEVKAQMASCVISDLGSANGTHVNGCPVKDRELEDGDVIAIGGTRIVFSKADEAG